MFFQRIFKSDRRRRKRRLLNRSVLVLTPAGRVEATGINISDVGMCLFTVSALPVGSAVELEFLPLRGTHVTRIPAIIRHRALYLYGVEFIGVPHAGEMHPREEKKVSATNT